MRQSNIFSNGMLHGMLHGMLNVRPPWMLGGPFGKFWKRTQSVKSRLKLTIIYIYICVCIYIYIYIFKICQITLAIGEPKNLKMLMIPALESNTISKCPTHRSRSVVAHRQVLLAQCQRCQGQMKLATGDQAPLSGGTWRNVDGWDVSTIHIFGDLAELCHIGRLHGANL